MIRTAEWDSCELSAYIKYRPVVSSPEDQLKFANLPAFVPSQKVEELRERERERERERGKKRERGR